MSALRRKLLEWLPFLGLCHRIGHGAWAAGARWWRRVRAAGRRLWCGTVEEARIQRAARRPAADSAARPIVHLYAVCRNEELLIPWLMDHYAGLVDRFCIYDNGSTDSTQAALARYPQAEVVPFDTGGRFDDAANQRIKNTAWMASRGQADFVIVCDMDEFLYHPHLAALLATMKRQRYTVLKPCGYQMVGERLPAFDGSRHLTDVVTAGVPDFHNYSKAVLFDPNRVDINYGPGAHRAQPTGEVRWFESRHVKLLHCKYVDRAEVLRKTREYRDKFSAENLAKGQGRHYRKSDEEALAEFDRMLAAGRKVI